MALNPASPLRVGAPSSVLGSLLPLERLGWLCLTLSFVILPPPPPPTSPVLQVTALFALLPQKAYLRLLRFVHSLCWPLSNFFPSAWLFPQELRLGSTGKPITESGFGPESSISGPPS